MTTDNSDKTGAPPEGTADVPASRVLGIHRLGSAEIILVLDKDGVARAGMKQHPGLVPMGTLLEYRELIDQAVKQAQLSQTLLPVLQPADDEE